MAVSLRSMTRSAPPTRSETAVLRAERALLAQDDVGLSLTSDDLDYVAPAADEPDFDLIESDEANLTYDDDDPSHRWIGTDRHSLSGRRGAEDGGGHGGGHEEAGRGRVEEVAARGPEEGGGEEDPGGENVRIEDGLSVI